MRNHFLQKVLGQSLVYIAYQTFTSGSATTASVSPYTTSVNTNKYGHTLKNFIRIPLNISLKVSTLYSAYAAVSPAANSHTE